MDVKITILIFLVSTAFFALCLFALRRFASHLARFMLEFWHNTGVLGSKDGSMDNSRINGFVLVGSVLFLLLGSMAVVAISGTRYGMLKFSALSLFVALFAPLVAKYFGGRKRK